MNTSKKTSSLMIEKAWGHEVIFVNNSKYCGKLLNFDSGRKFSMHYHLLKEETWYIAKGSFRLYWIDTDTARMNTETLVVGDVVHLPQGQPHQLEALEESTIFEVSTQHFDNDSYRVVPGDSQK